MGPFTHEKRRFPTENLDSSIERNRVCKCGDESLQKGESMLERRLFKWVRLNMNAHVAS